MERRHPHPERHVPGVAGRTDVPARAVRRRKQAAPRPDLRRGPGRGVRQPGEVSTRPWRRPRPLPATATSTSAGCFPTAAQTARCQRLFPRAPGASASDLRAALDKDFNADAFAPFWKDWDAWTAANAGRHRRVRPGARLLGGLREVLPLPLQFLWSDERPGSAWVATTVNDGLYQKLPPAALLAPNIPIDQTQTINAALRRYRLAASQRAGVGLALIALAVLAIYGWRRGVFMLVIPALSILLTLAVLGFMGQTLGLLHVVALLLGFCLASDYSIFLGSPRRASPQHAPRDPPGGEHGAAELRGPEFQQDSGAQGHLPDGDAGHRLRARVLRTGIPVVRAADSLTLVATGRGKRRPLHALLSFASD